VYAKVSIIHYYKQQIAAGTINNYWQNSIGIPNPSKTLPVKHIPTYLTKMFALKCVQSVNVIFIEV